MFLSGEGAEAVVFLLGGGALGVVEGWWGGVSADLLGRKGDAHRPLRGGSLGMTWLVRLRQAADLWVS